MENKKEKNEIKIGAILSYIVIILNMFIGIVYTPILTRMLGQAEYGLYSLISNVIAYLTILDLGFGNAIIVYTTRYKAKGEKEKEQNLHGMFLIIYTLIGIIASLIGLLLYFNVDKMFGNTMSLEELEKAKVLMGILTFNLAITFPFSVFTSIITAYEKFIFSKIVSIIHIILKPIIMIPLLLLGYKSIALVIIITFTNLFSLILNTYFCLVKIKIQPKFKKIDFKVLPEILSYSIWIALNTIIDKVNWAVDSFILGTVSGTISVAVYSIASQLNTMYLQFSTAISNVLLPKVTKMEAKNATEKEFTEIFIKVGRIQFILMALIISGFILFGKEFITMVWVGKEYSEAYIMACILMIPVTIPLIQNVGLSILQAKNKYKYRTIIFFFIAIGNVLISIPLAKRFGGVGSSIGTAISLIIGQILIMNWYYWKKIRIDIPLFWKNIIKMFIPIVAVNIIGIIIKSIWNIGSIIILLIQIIIFTIIYTVCVWRFVMNNYEKEILLKPFKKVIIKIRSVVGK